MTTLVLDAGPPVAGHRLPVRLTGAAAVAVLLVLLFGAWEPRLATTGATEAGPAVPVPTASAPEIDAEAVVEEASHHIVGGPTGTLVVADDAYHARFDPAGFSYDVYAGRVDGAGRVLDGTGFAVSTATAEENFIAVARGGGTSWGVVYKSGIRSSAVIEWRKVNPSSK